MAKAGSIQEEKASFCRNVVRNHKSQSATGKSREIFSKFYRIDDQYCLRMPCRGLGIRVPKFCCPSASKGDERMGIGQFRISLVSRIHSAPSVGGCVSAARRVIPFREAASADSRFCLKIRFSKCF